MKIYLHIGAGKCASSTIQNYFSYNHSADGFMYGCLREAGHVIFGNDVKNSAIISPGNYAVSWSFKTETDDEFELKFRESLALIATKTDRLLLSCEGWSSKAPDFEKLSRVFEPYEVEVIFIVRPPVQWMNSAWWQWHQWSKDKVDPWANKANVAKGWVDAYESFKALPFVGKVNVLALHRGILKDIGDLVGVDVVSHEKVHNSASSSELLNFFKVKRSLRKGPHDAQSEFVLNKYLRKRSGSDWVLSAKNIENILQNTKQSCETLAGLISNVDIKADGLWWDVASYENKVAKLQRNKRLNRQVLASMLDEAYHIIIDLDKKVRFQGPLQESGREIIDIALSLEDTNLEEAYRLMKIAKRIRPQGDVVAKKLEEYEVRLSQKKKH